MAAGADNIASNVGAARASAYTINQDGTVSPAFTKTFANILAGQVFTSHSLKWSVASSSLNILVDNQTVHNSNSSNISYNYTLYGYDNSGNQLWASNPRPGEIVQISCGSARSIYVLGTRAPGELLVSYGPNGILRWSRSSVATDITAALDQGVVAGDSAVDGTGHHHVHITKFSITGPQLWTTTYASQNTNDDTLANLQWLSGRIFLSGQVTPGSGNKQVFGAEYDRTP